MEPTQKLYTAFRAQFCVPVATSHFERSYFDLSKHNEEMKPRPRYGTKAYAVNRRSVLNGYVLRQGTTRQEVKLWLTRWLAANQLSGSVRSIVNALIHEHQTV